MVRINKKIVVIIVVVIIVILFCLGLLFNTGRLQKGKLFSKPIQKQSTTTTVASRLNNDQIADLLLQWANNTRTENGGYAEGEWCTNKGVCDPFFVDNRIGAVGLWARFKHYLKYQDSESMSIMAKDILIYSDPQKVSTIQPVFWNCKLLYELWKSPLFSQAQKNNIENICARSVYATLDLTYNQNVSIPETSLNQITQQMAGKGQRNQLFFFNEQVDVSMSSEYAAFASDYAGMYQWAQDKEDLKRAQISFIAAVSALRNNINLFQLTEMAPLVGLASLDLNKITPNPLYVQYADWLIKQYKNTSCPQLQGCVMRAFLYNELYKLNKKEEYRQERDKIISKLYDERFDYKGLSGFRIGKGAFYDSLTKNQYMMVSNTVLAGLLLDMQ